MALPDNKELYLPILRFFSDKNSHSKIEIYDKTVTYFDLTKEDLNQTVGNSKIFKFERKFNLVFSYLVSFKNLCDLNFH